MNYKASPFEQRNVAQYGSIEKVDCESKFVASQSEVQRRYGDKYRETVNSI